jgi:hypothetical protein
LDSEQKLPVWLQATKLAEFPVRRMNNNIMQCRLALPRTWPIEPTLKENPLEIEQVFQGINLGECLVLNFMQSADPEGDLKSWVELIVKVTGLPILPIALLLPEPPQLLQWEGLENHASWLQHFQVDELYLYQGLAQLRDESALMHLYTILARRDMSAWKISLALTGNTDQGIAAQARNPVPAAVRAAAILGELEFL